MKLITYLADESATQDLAVSLANCLINPLIVIFKGEIGVGKTTFIRALIQTLGVKSTIKSPTYSLVESYQCPRMIIHHFDLYRIHDETELEYIGWRDYFIGDALCCIEWPERAGANLAIVDLAFAFAMKGSGRRVTIEALSAAGGSALSCLAGKQALCE